LRARYVCIGSVPGVASVRGSFSQCCERVGRRCPSWRCRHAVELCQRTSVREATTHACLAVAVGPCVA